jgi:hypothetical protein
MYANESAVNAAVTTDIRKAITLSTAFSIPRICANGSRKQAKSVGMLALRPAPCFNGGMPELTRRRINDWLFAALGICGSILSPIAIFVLITGYYFPWSRAMLSKHQWLIVVLVLIFLSRFLLGEWLSYQMREALDEIHSPEGQRRRAEAVQIAIAEIIGDAHRLPSHAERYSGGHPMLSARVMTEARRIAKNIAKEKLKSRGIKVNYEVKTSEISKIANALVETDPSIIETALANLGQRSKG